MAKCIHKFIVYLGSYSPQWAAVWLGLLYISICGVADLPGSTVLFGPLWMKWVIVILICCLKASVIVVTLRLCQRCKVMYMVAVSAVIIYSILCIINGISYYFYNMGITIKLMTVLSQTNGNEVREFIPLLVSNIRSVLSHPKVYIVAVLVVLSLIGTKKVNKRVFGITATVLSSIGLVILMPLLYSLQFGRTNFSVIGRTIKSVRQSYNERKQIEMYMSFISPLPYPETIKSRQLADVYLIIGESASRGHLSIYGYPLATSPVLDKIDEGLIVFDNAIGSSTLTAFNMNRILTFLSDRDIATKWSESPMLYSLLKKAGYHTAWISNQERAGMWGNPTLAMVSDADCITYVGSISSDDAILMRYDASVLPEVVQMAANDSEPKFIGVHLMGSHMEFSKRYPDSFNIFNADSVMKIKRDFALSPSHATTIAEYDNSIRYTDHIIGQILHHIESSQRPAVMIYFSDHGENVYDDNDNYLGRDSKHVEVPFVIYANSSFRERNRNLYERLENAASRPLTTANIEHLICTLTGTEYQCYNAKLDVSSPSFVPIPRFVDDAVWQYEHDY